jgi:hypothetical protein
MSGWMDKVKKAGKSVVDAGAKQMLKVRHWSKDVRVIIDMIGDGRTVESYIHKLVVTFGMYMCSTILL